MQVWQPQDPFRTITSLSEIYFRLRFILSVQIKKTTMAAAQAAEKHEDE